MTFEEMKELLTCEEGKAILNNSKHLDVMYHVPNTEEPFIGITFYQGTALESTLQLKPLPLKTRIFSIFYDAIKPFIDTDTVAAQIIANKKRYGYRKPALCEMDDVINRLVNEMIDLAEAFDALEDKRWKEKEPELIANAIANLDAAQKNRYSNLKFMHEDMLHLNNEDGYWEWATVGMPDEPSEWDFISTAEDEEAYIETLKAYWRIRTKYEKDGWYNSKTKKCDYEPQYNMKPYGMTI